MSISNCPITITDPNTHEEFIMVAELLKGKISYQSLICWRRALKELPEEVRDEIPYLPNTDYYYKKMAYFTMANAEKFNKFYDWYKAKGRGLMRDYNRKKNKRAIAAIEKVRNRKIEFKERGFNKKVNNENYEI